MLSPSSGARVSSALPQAAAPNAVARVPRTPAGSDEIGKPLKAVAAAAAI